MEDRWRLAKKKDTATLQLSRESNQSQEKVDTNNGKKPPVL